jgi:hypothetical protein
MDARDGSTMPRETRSGHPHTPPRRGVSLAPLLAALLALPPARAGLRQESWESRDAELIAREAAQGGEAERLLASTLGQRDPRLLVRDMRRLAGLEAPDWIRREALSALCEYFCVMEQADSLAVRSREYAALAGRPFDCRLAAPAAGGVWWVQAGAFSSEANAIAALKATGVAKDQRRVAREGGLWKARLGPFASRAEAQDSAAALEKAGRLEEYRLVEEKAGP